MSKAKNKIDRQRPQAHKVPARPKKLLAMALGAILVSAPGLAMAQATSTVDWETGTGSIISATPVPPHINVTNPSTAPVVNSDTGDTLVNAAAGLTSTNNIITIKGNTNVAETVTIDGSANGKNLLIWTGLNGPQRELTMDKGVNDNGILRIRNIAAGVDADGYIALQNLAFVGGLNTTAVGGNDFANRAFSGGGLFVGLTTEDGLTGASFVDLNMENILFKDNVVNITMIAGQVGAAAGGGFAINNGTGVAENGTLHMDNITVIGNKVLANDANSILDAGTYLATFGGGGQIIRVAEINFRRGGFNDNQAVTTNGASAAGGGLAVEHSGTNGAEYSLMQITGNTAKLDGFTSDTDVREGWATGGGFYAYNTGDTYHDFIGSLIEKNTAQAIEGAVTTKNTFAFGGGASLRGAANGGFGESTIVKGNVADGTLADFAMGGGIASTGMEETRAGYIDVYDSSVVQGNEAKVSETGGAAYGGGIYARGNVYIEDSSVIDNLASGFAAYGGGLYVDLSDRTIADNNNAISYSTNGNRVTALTTELSASAGKVSLIKGNKAKDSSNHPTDDYSGFHFGYSDAGGSVANAVLNVSGEGQVHLLDPVNVRLDSLKGSATATVVNAGLTTVVSTYNMYITNDGGAQKYADYIAGHSQTVSEFVWGGANTVDVVYNTAGAFGVNVGNHDRASITVTGGLMRLTADYSLDVLSTQVAATQVNNFTVLDVDLRGGTNTNVVMLNTGDPRTITGAIYDFTGANTQVGNESTFAVDGKTVFTAADQRSLYRTSGTYVLVEGVDGLKNVKDGDGNLYSTYADGTELNVQKEGGVDKVYKKGDQILVDVKYEGTYTGMINAAGKNSVSAVVGAFDNLIDDQYRMSDADLNVIVADGFRTLTPEYALDQAMASTRITGQMGDWARKIGLQDPWRRGYNNMPDPCPEGFRLWSGYVGMFNSNDSHGGYRGYDVDTNGFLLGGNWEFAKGAIGIYGGFSKSDTEMNGIKSKVETDGVQFGIQGRLNPFEDVPNLSFYGDVAYASYDNDGWRDIKGNREKGSFDQDAWTIGLGVNYLVNFDSFALTPFLNLRYTSLDQDGFREKGWETSTRVNGVDVDSFTSTLGAEIRTEFTFDGGYFAPYASAAWRHEFGDEQADGRGSYVDAARFGAGKFKLSSLEADTDSADLGLGFDVMFDIGTGGQQLGINVSYEANIGSDSDTQTVFGGLQYRF